MGRSWGDRSVWRVMAFLRMPPRRRAHSRSVVRRMVGQQAWPVKARRKCRKPWRVVSPHPRTRETNPGEDIPLALFTLGTSFCIALATLISAEVVKAVGGPMVLSRWRMLIGFLML